MDSYVDRIGKFSDMISTTNDHIKAIQDMRINPRDPLGTGLNIAGSTIGGIGGIAGAVSGMQHFKDFKTMYGGLKNTLEKSVNSGGNKPSTDSLGSQASDKVQSGQTDEIQPEDVDEIASRINNLDKMPYPTGEANEINKAINSKINSSLDPFQKIDLNNAVRASGRANDATTANAMQEGEDKIAAQKSYLNFKNNASNDAISKVNSGQDIPESYDESGKPNTVETTEQPQPQSNVNNVAQGNESDLVQNATDSVENAVGDHVNAAADLEGQTQSLIERGRAALSNLTGGQSVPGRMGEAVDGLRVNPSFNPNDLGSVLVPSPEISRILKGMGHSGSRIWVVDNHHRVLAQSGTIQNADGVWADGLTNQAPKTWWQRFEQNYLHPIYYKILTRPENEFLDTLHDVASMQGTHLAKALKGQPASSWRLTPDSKAVILSAAYPIWIQDQVIGAVIAEETTNGVRTLRNKSLEKLFNVILAVMLIGTVTLFFFASRISNRIRRLRDTAEQAIKKFKIDKEKDIPTKL